MSLKLIKSMSLLTFGVILSKIIGVVSLPILTRLYEPADFGYYSIVIAAISILLPLATGMLEIAIPLPKNQNLVRGIITAAFINLLLFSVFLYFILIIYGSEIQLSMNIESHWLILTLIPIGILATGSYEITQYILTRDKLFRISGFAIAIQGFLAALFKILFVCLPTISYGLISGHIISHLIVGILFLNKRFKYIFSIRNLRFYKRNVGNIYGGYRKIIIFRIPSQFILRVAIHLPVLVISQSYFIENSGQFSLALTVLALPMALVGHTMGRVYYAEAASIGRNDIEKLKDITKSVIITMFMIAICPTIILYIWGEEIFSLIFGAKWIQAGEIASILSIFLLFQFISTPIINVMSVLKKDHILLALNIFRLLAVVITLSISVVADFEFLLLIKFYSYSLSLFYIASSLIIYKNIK